MMNAVTKKKKKKKLVCPGMRVEHINRTSAVFDLSGRKALWQLILRRGFFVDFSSSEDFIGHWAIVNFDGELGLARVDDLIEVH